MKIQRVLGVAAALCTCAGLAATATAQCTGYTIQNPGPAMYIPATTDIGNHADDGTTLIALPFAVTVYGNSYTQALVSSNGNLQFAATGSTAFTNACLPTTTFTAPTIMPLWDDLYTVDTAGGQGVFTATTGVAPNRQFIIEWRTAQCCASGAPVNRFEVIFTEGSSNFDLVYNLVNGSGSAATVGVQSSTTGPFTQFSCNTATVTAGLSLRFNCVAPSMGACCSGAGVCAISNSASCTGTSFYVGANTVCSPDPCAALLGACCAVNGTCSATIQQGCVSGSTFQSAGSICSPNPCPQPPANDECPGTLLLASGGMATATGTTLTASTTAGSGASCGNVGTNDVWYEFVPDVSTTYTANLCSSPSAWDSVLSIHTACPGTSANQIAGACNDDGCVAGIGLSAITTPFALTAGTHYWVRVAGYPTIITPPGANRGNFNLLITGAAIGRCCSADTLTCNVTTQAACTGTNTWTTSLTCSGGCPAPSGQCCAANGGCTVTTQTGCTSGTWNGTVTTCTPNTCPQPAGSCCATDGTCTEVLGVGACTGTFTVAGTCSPNPCPQAGACCSTAGVCTFVVQTSCTGTSTWSAGSCTPSPCPAAGACCSATGVCTEVIQTSCTGTSIWSAGSCTPNPCPPSGSCCVGSCCTVTLQAGCTGVWAEAGICSPNPCPASVNDACSAAIAISSATLPATAAGNNCNATADGPAGSCTAGTANSVWWSFTPSYTGAYTINTCGSGFDTVLVIFSGDCNTPVQVGCDDDEPTCSNTLNSQIAGLVLNAGQTYLIRVGSFSAGIGNINVTINGDSASGSCCATDGSCTQTDANDCPPVFTFSAGGVCTPNPCAQPNGACCCGSSCTITAPAGCTGSGRTFAGSGTACTPFSFTAPCCRGDYNKTGTVSVQDIFDFLSGYFSNSACADSNDTGTISVQDIFDFLSAYFGGC